MLDHKQDIKNLLLELVKKYPNIPNCCLNKNAPNNKVYYSGPDFDLDEMVSAIEALLFSKWSSAGEYCHKFEVEFAKTVNNDYAVSCNSGSSANLIMIGALKEYFNWKDNDSIILSSVGFPTTNTSLTYHKLKPVFIDVELKTLNFDISKIEELLEWYEMSVFDLPKAIFLSPILGNPCNIDKLLEICNKYKLKLILDCCDSIKSQWDNKQLTEYAIVSSFSFYPAHEICTLEGGMVTSNNKKIIDIARSFSTWGRACFCFSLANCSQNGLCNSRFSNWIKELPDTILDHRYLFDREGFNLKMLDICAAIGLEQLKKLDYFCKKRIENQQKISSLFAKYISDISFPEVLEKSLWVPFATPIICNNRKQKQSLVKYLESKNIQTRNCFAGNTTIQKAFRKYADWTQFEQANKINDLVFFVGCAPTISEENIEYIKQVLKNYPRQ